MSWFHHPARRSQPERCCFRARFPGYDFSVTPGSLFPALTPVAQSHSVIRVHGSVERPPFPRGEAARSSRSPRGSLPREGPAGHAAPRGGERALCPRCGLFPSFRGSLRLLAPAASCEPPSRLKARIPWCVCRSRLPLARASGYFRVTRRLHVLRAPRHRAGLGGRDRIGWTQRW